MLHNIHILQASGWFGPTPIFNKGIIGKNFLNINFAIFCNVFSGIID